MGNLPTKVEICGLNAHYVPEKNERGVTDVEFYYKTYDYTIDAKKRLFIPAKYRQELGDSFYLYFDPRENFIAVYGEEEWEIKCREAMETRNAAYQRFFFSNVDKVETDKQGRITLDSRMCEGAHLKKEVTVIGVGNRIEIWDAATYAKEMEKLSTISDTFPTVIN